MPRQLHSRRRGGVCLRLLCDAGLPGNNGTSINKKGHVSTAAHAPPEQHKLPLRTSSSLFSRTSRIIFPSSTEMSALRRIFTGLPPAYSEVPQRPEPTHTTVPTETLDLGDSTPSQVVQRDAKARLKFTSVAWTATASLVSIAVLVILYVRGDHMTTIFDGMQAMEARMNVSRNSISLYGHGADIHTACAILLRRSDPRTDKSRLGPEHANVCSPRSREYHHLSTQSVY